MFVLRGRGGAPADPRLGKGGPGADAALGARSVAGLLDPDPIDDPVRLGGGGSGENA